MLFYIYLFMYLFELFMVTSILCIHIYNANYNINPEL